MKRRFLSSMTSAFCILALAACSQPSSAAQKFGGMWIMRLGEHTFLVLALKESGDKVSGTLTRPERFEVGGAGSRFSKISPEEVSELITTGSIQGDHLRFMTTNPKDATDTSDYEVVLTGTAQATLKIVDAPFEAWPITKVPDGETATVYKGWDARRAYPEYDNVASNPEMQKIYEADQQPRQNQGQLTSAEWAVISRDDVERRKQTAKLLADGSLHSAEDFNRAAFIFQHGDTPEDYLLAHTLSMIAVARGDQGSLWIGAATLDRYLQSVGKSQIYGTQFKSGKDATQEPFNRELISDALRRDLGVPSLAAQQDQQKYWAEQSNSTTRKP